MESVCLMRLHMLWQPEKYLDIALVLHPLVAVAVKAQPVGNLDLQPCATLPRILPCLYPCARCQLWLLPQLRY